MKSVNKTMMGLSFLVVLCQGTPASRADMPATLLCPPGTTTYLDKTGAQTCVDPWSLAPLRGPLMQLRPPRPIASNNQAAPKPEDVACANFKNFGGVDAPGITTQFSGFSPSANGSDSGAF